jgi:hypothetical protein
VWLLAALGAAGTVACPGNRGGSAGPDASPEASASEDAKKDAGWVIPAASLPQQLDHSIYPEVVPPHPLATRLCSVLHGTPVRRKSECCKGPVPNYVESECVRLLSASLHTGLVTLDPPDVDRCEAAVTASLTGCDWVTVSEALAPDACQGILHGTLDEGKVCRSSLDCKGNMHCEGASPTRTGRCSPPAAPGAGCGGSPDALATATGQRDLDKKRPQCGAFCSFKTHRCEPYPEAGTPCLANIGCGPQQICAAGKCSDSAPGKVGDACDKAPCAPDLVCRSGKCIARVGAGDECKNDFDCAVGGCSRRDDGKMRCGMKCSYGDLIGNVAGGHAAGAPSASASAPRPGAH